MAANTLIAGLIVELGFAPKVLGRITEGGVLLDHGAPLVLQNLVWHG
ncbi:MAG: hypothetical protein H7197_12985 [Vitreoscilla sp.]|nr:hypothetical protein [Polaromonas sp.]